MKTLLKSLVLMFFATPAFGQIYGYQHYPYYPSYSGYAPQVYVPPMHVVNPAGYRPDYMHAMMNPYYAQQYALDLSYQMNLERNRQAMEQAAIQREALWYKAPEMRERKEQKRMASQQRRLAAQAGKPVIVIQPDKNANNAAEPDDGDQPQLQLRDF
jgi:hypothetical protein